MWYDNIEMNEFVGNTIIKIDRSEDELQFTFSNGMELKMYHEQDCCESVTIEDICGDLDDLLNSPVTVAEERTNSDPNASESATWTFYYISTNKGSVTIRWYGASNGYYSEGISLAKIKGANGIPNFEDFMEVFSTESNAFTEYTFDDMREAFDAGQAFANTNEEKK